MPRQRKSADLRRTAIHEAGHAVIGRVLDLDCGPASIVPDADSSGHAETADPWETLARWEERYHEEQEGRCYRDPPRYEKVILGRMLTFMAGAAAEEELLGECDGGDEEDRYQIALMAEQLDVASLRAGGDEAWERYEVRLRRHTRRVVRKHRHTVERVADAFLVQGTLQGAELDALIPDAPATRRPGLRLTTS